MECDIRDVCSICKGIFNSFEVTRITEEILDHLKFLIPNWCWILENAPVCLTCLDKIQMAFKFKNSYLETYQHVLLPKTESLPGYFICDMCKSICDQNESIPMCDWVSETGSNLIRYLSVELETKLQDNSQTCEMCSKSLLNFYWITNLLETVGKDSDSIDELNKCDIIDIKNSEIINNLRVVNPIKETVGKDSESIDELNECDIIDIKNSEIINNLSVVNPIKTEIKEEEAEVSTFCTVKEENEDTCDNEDFYFKNEEVDFKMESEDSSEEAGKRRKSGQEDAENNSSLSHNDGFQFNLTKIKTKCKKPYTTNTLVHNSEEIKTFKCPNCVYKTADKSNLTRHMLVHKTSEEVKMFKCHMCDFQTKHKISLKNHAIFHKNFDEVKMFKCHMCDFQTKYKGNLKNHTKIHKNSYVKIFKCQFCEFKSKYQLNLKVHMIIHKNSYEVEMFKCHLCEFETKYKHSLKEHKKSCEVEIFKCQICDYKSNNKYTVARHMFTHKNSDEIEMFKCHICKFDTKYKRSLKGHIKKYPQDTH